MTPLEVDLIMQQVLDSHLDRHARDLTAAWVEAWRAASAELDATLVGMVTPGRAGEMPVNPRRLTHALKIIEDELVSLAAQAGAEIASSAADVVRLGASGTSLMLTEHLPEGATFHRADIGQLDAITETVTGQIVSTTRAIATDTLTVVRRRLVAGVTIGDSPRLVADQIMADTHGAFDGGLHRALVISRTEMLDAMRAGQRAAEYAAADVLRGWVWATHLDAKTCPACAAMHGTEWPTEEPGPLGHQQCRCARIPLTKSWADLGFKGIPDPGIELQDAGEWFDGLATDEQRNLLGPARFEAWRGGTYPMDRWAVRQTNPGWRDSFVTSPLPGEDDADQ